MKRLNKTSTRVLSTLIEKASTNQGYSKIENSGFMPLSIERISSDAIVKSPYGNGTIYSLAHYYEQNGDLMADPEMTFFVIKKESEVYAWPMSYKNDGTAFFKESVNIEASEITTYSPSLQSDQCSFANMWLRNIKNQGFLS